MVSMAASPLLLPTTARARRIAVARPPRTKTSEVARVDFLNLGGWQTTSIGELTNGEIEVRAELLTHPEACLNCGAPPSALRHNGTKRQSVRDVPHGGKYVIIRFHRRRFICRLCRKTTPQPLAGVDARRRLTRRLVELIEKEAFDTRSSFVAVAARLGVSERTVRNVFTERAVRLSRTARVEAPRRLGIDGVYVGRKERCILTDLDSGRVVEILPDRGNVSVSKFLATLPGKERVEAVAMDMCRGFAVAARRWLPRAAVVIDTFHVQRMANQQLIAVFRRHVQSRMARKPRRKKGLLSARANERKVRRTRFLLARRRGRLSAEEAEELLCWRREFPVLDTAYKLKENFLNVWQSETRREAERRYEAWVQRVEKLMPWGFQRLRQTVSRWRELIFNYFDRRGVTNAGTEALNNTVKTLQRVGRGYSFHVLRAKLLYREAVTGRAYARRTVRSASRPAPRPVNPRSNVGRLRSAYEERVAGTLSAPPANALWLRRFGRLGERPVARPDAFARPTRSKKPAASKSLPLFAGLR